MHERPRILVISGFFDWFSGYQEIGLVRALRKSADTYVLTGDQVNPIFKDAHIQALGLERRYQPGTTTEEGVTLLRLPVAEVRSMVWSPRAVRAVEARPFDHIIQVFPGHLLPLAASLARTQARKSVLYGDNSAMYASLSPQAAALKFRIFSATKGRLYQFINRRADHLYGYTPETIRRLAPFSAGHEMELLPLAYDDEVFSWSPALRREARTELGIAEDEFTIIAPGKVQPQKRFDALIEAALQHIRQGRKIRIVLAGLDRSSTSDDLRRHVRQSGFSEHFMLFEFTTAARLNALFNASDLGVWPAMPAITIQQAMGTGLRVALPTNDIVQHLIRNPSSGPVFEAGEDLTPKLFNVMASEAAVKALYASDALREARCRENLWLSTAALAERILTSPARTGWAT
ncbi:glycosyltransferase [Arsenicicoccus bolidensis]|uniref:glycosyltransferase n=1 Tax=Arsenicicoccus bolidensis TaxID=229480 RepID=UPI000492322A|nr:glycosyltransferase [Arsenicicoccus bolidensis]